MSGERQGRMVVHNGRLVPFEDAGVAPNAVALNYAALVFEGVRGYLDPASGEIVLFRLRDHLRRLAFSMRLLRLEDPPGLDEIERGAVVPTFMTLASANTVVNLASHPTKGRPPQPGEVERVTYATGKLGEKVTGAEYVRATQAAHRLGRQMAAFHTSWDVLVTPALATLPPHLGWIDMMMEDVNEYWHRVFTFSPFTVWFNITGQPAIVLPLFGTAAGFPVSVQLAARYGDEATLFRLASQLEAARPWFNRKPPVATEEMPR